MNYITVPQLKERVRTELSDTTLEDIISEASALITFALGSEPASSSTENVVQTFYKPESIIWLSFRPALVTVIDKITDTIILPDSYTVSGRAITKNATKYTRICWPDKIEVTYTIANYEHAMSLIRSACVDICKLIINNLGGYRSLSVSKVSRAFNDFEQEKLNVIGMLTFNLQGIRPMIAK